jgi:hypothetical protein
VLCVRESPALKYASILIPKAVSAVFDPGLGYVFSYLFLFSVMKHILEMYLSPVDILMCTLGVHIIKLLGLSFVFFKEKDKFSLLLHFY